MCVAFKDPEMGNVTLMQVEGQTEDELVFLLAHDKDSFCRWEAGQRLLRGLLTSLYSAGSASKVPMHPCILNILFLCKVCFCISHAMLFGQRNTLMFRCNRRSFAC